MRIADTELTTPIAASLALALAAAAALLALTLRAGPEPALSPSAEPTATADAARAYGGLPLAFEPSAGRAGPGVDYIARTAGSTHSVGSAGATIALPGSALRISLVGAAASAPAALGRLPGVVNSFIGKDRSRWRTGLPTFERVRYREVWPGIDVDWYGNARRLEYDFSLAPGANPGRIALRLTGQDSLRISPAGDLIIRAGGRTLRQPAPLAYQPAAEGRDRVSAAWTLDGRTAGFRLGAFDRSRPLVIDPLVYLAVVEGIATGAGAGALNPINDVVVDSSGQAYISGGAFSSTFPTTPGAFDTQLDGSGAPAEGTYSDAFVTKLNASGTAAVYSTFLGGGSTEEGRGIAIDADGDAFVTGVTASTDYPTTSGLDQSLAGSTDAFVTRLNATGTGLVWSAYLGSGGGGGDETGEAVAVGPAGGDPVVVGRTTSTNFPTADAPTSDPCDYQDSDPDGTSASDAFYANFDPGGNRVCSTYIGGDGADTATDVAVGVNGSTEVAFGVVGNTDSTDFPVTSNAEQGSPQGGTDAWAFRFSFPFSFITYFGGDGEDSAAGVAVDQDGELYLTGRTDSNVDGGGGDFPVTAGSFQDADPEPDGPDGFVAAFSNVLGAPLDYSSFLGGGGGDTPAAVAVDPSGAAHVSGGTQSSDFPTTPGALDTTPSGSGDVFLAKLKPDGSGLSYGTYLSGGGSDIATAVALDSAGAAYLTGSTTQGVGQPVTPGSFDAEAGSFLAKITPVAAAKCQGRFPTRTGTNGADVLFGTNGPDVFAGMGGSDRILGLGGKDVACGGPGGDAINGGAGADRLNGEAGKDKLFGAGGRDRLSGAGGKDTCVGGPGRDRARGCERKRSIRR